MATNTHVESRRTASGIVPLSDIVKCRWLMLEDGVNERVQEAKWGLALRQTRRVEQGEDPRDGRGGCRGTVKVERPIADDHAKPF